MFLPNYEIRRISGNRISGKLIYVSRFRPFAQFLSSVTWIDRTFMEFLLVTNYFQVVQVPSGLDVNLSLFGGIYLLSVLKRGWLFA